MQDRKSIYARNKKDTDAIVYTSADGKIERLTQEDFKTREEFEKWKAWSDANYHVEEKRDHVYFDHTLSLAGLSDESAASLPLEIMLEQRRQDQQRRKLCAVGLSYIKDILTEKQYRRLWKYYVKGMTEQQIADLEGVGQRRVSESILGARKKVLKRLAKQGLKLPQNPR